jgi:hypothetical protein
MSDKSFDILYLELWSSLHEAIVYMLENPECLLFKEGFPAADRYLAYNNMLWLLNSASLNIEKLRRVEAEKAGFDMFREDVVTGRFTLKED